MSTARERPWTPVALEEDGLVARVERDVAARELAQELVGSKAAARRILASGQLCRLQGDERIPVAATAQLGGGDLVRLSYRRTETPAPDVAAATPEVTIVYKDSILLATDKPAGLLVHGDGTGADTLTARVRAQLARQGSAAVPQAVQRLDVETTGLVIFSLTEEFQPALDAQVAGHDMAKRYLAVIEGRLSGTEDAWRELSWPIGRDRHDARRMRASNAGKPALTRARTLAQAHGRSLLLVELATGRRHQIRVHLARAGHPLVGDALYGGAAHADGLMLHAWQERLVHPVTGAPVELATEVPPRFARLFPSFA